MSDASLARRVDMLEETVNSLKQLPERFVTLEHRFDGLEGRFITVEGGLITVAGRLGVVESQIVQLRTEMRDESGVNRDLTGHIVETQRQMRVLYEDLVARITTLG